MEPLIAPVVDFVCPFFTMKFYATGALVNYIRKHFSNLSEFEIRFICSHDLLL